MNTQKSIRIILLLIGSIGLLMIYYYNFYENHILALRKLTKFPKANLFPNSTGTVGEPNAPPGYAIYGPNCKMLDPEPWHPSLKKYLKKIPPVQCSRSPPLTYIDQRDGFSNVLRINEAAFNRYKGKENRTLKCFYRIIKRFTMTPEDFTIFPQEKVSYEFTNYTEFTKQVALSMDTEFIHVRCNFTEDNICVYGNIHSVVPLLPEVVPKLRNQTNKRSILILALDSLSKLNLRRTMPKTLKYLKEKNWLELKGYHKVGDNTYPNIMALFTGRSLAQLENCMNKDAEMGDDCFTLWPEYNRRGYVTFYAEDYHNMFTFNFTRTGFIKKPTDYYMRPFAEAAVDVLDLKIRDGFPVCFGPMLAVDHALDYGRSFLRAFKNTSNIALIWLNSLTHSNVNTPKNLDPIVHKFLRDLSDLGTYENSFVFLLSDHGCRIGMIRESFLGFLEDRLPFMFIWTPKWFRERHPVEYRNLVVNGNRLTSTYDVYVTLRKLMDEEGEVAEPVSRGCPKCRGLFEELPLDRSCEEASIDLTWCLCSEFKSVSVNAKVVKKIAEYVHSNIVNKTKALLSATGVDPSLCASWKFHRVARVQEIIPSRSEHQYSFSNARNVGMERQADREIVSNIKVFVIVVEYQRGKIKFESIVQVNETAGNSSFVTLEFPKRLDSIYRTSKCVYQAAVKYFCICRRVLNIKY